MNEAVFHEAAVEALREAPPCEHVGWLEVVRDFMRGSGDDEALVWPPQRQDPFGQPPLTLYTGDRFFIQMLCWLDATTSIHQHAFSGAFHVLHGSSMHGQYDFRERKRINSGFLVGDLEFRAIEMLAVGDTRPIRSGRGFIHSLFHLEQPSVTIVIRTVNDHEAMPQMEFLRPHLAEDAFLSDQTLLKRRQVLQMLGRVDPDEMLRVAERLVGEADFQTCWHAVEGAFRFVGVRVEGVVEAARRRHGQLVDVMAPVLEEIRWRDALVGQRSRVTDPELRFFLALLLNVAGRADVLRFTAARFGDEPRTRLLRWLRSLARVDDAGQVEVLQMALPPLLPGLPARLAAEPLFALLDGLMEGRTVPMALKRLTHDYPAAQVEAGAARIGQVVEDLRRSPLRALVVG